MARARRRRSSRSRARTQARNARDRAKAKLVKAPGELWLVARSLGDALDEVVFVGGMIRELLITDPAAGPARPTQDVDCIVDAKSYADYLQLCDRLRARGFAECTDEGAPICRWTVHDVRVDMM